MITWPIFLALILAFFAVRYTINMEDAAEAKIEKKAKDEQETKHKINDLENSKNK